MIFRRTMTFPLVYLLRRNSVYFATIAGYALIATPLVASGILYGDVIVTSGIFFILVMGLDLLYGYTGLLSFGHIAFFAIGAYTVAVLAKLLGLSLLGGGLAALLLNLMLALTLGRILLRLSGSYFMLGTLAFGIMVHAVITTWYPVTGGDAGLGDVPQARMGELSPTLSLAIIIWGTTLALFWLAMNLAQSRVGRALRAIRSDEVSAACSCIPVARLKTNIFALSAGYASVSGSLFAAYNGVVHPDSFSLSALLDVLLMLFFGGEGTIWGGLIGVTVLRTLPDLSGPLHAGKILFSGVLFAVIIYLFPRGIAGGIRRIFAHLARRPAAAVLDAALVRAPAIVGDAPVLKAENIGQSFGGLRAVDDVSFSIDHARIKSLIGPNGAGKSTLLNLISGVQTLREGRILFRGEDVTGRRPDAIARLGMQRTFQHERLFTHLSVIENVMVGCEHGSDGSARELFRCALALPRTLREEQRVRAQAAAWLATIGLAERADDPVAVLPHGLRKLVEVARAAAAQPSLLLLDETAAGLNDNEKQSLKAFIRRLRDAGITILLIEHDMEFVMDISDQVLVVNFGRRIAEGSPAEVRQDKAVLAAYLGT